MNALELACEIIKKFEGLVLTAYPDPASPLAKEVRKRGIKIWEYQKFPDWNKYSGTPWTIGYGNTFYDGSNDVKQGDVITKEKANELLLVHVKDFMNDVEGCLKVSILGNQLAALTSFAYNCGMGNFRKSTLLKKVNANPNDVTIRDEFMKWVKAGGNVLPGLVKRRSQEADLYFKS